jgi:hypothetical protein
VIGILTMMSQALKTTASCYREPFMVRELASSTSLQTCTPVVVDNQISQ